MKLTSVIAKNLKGRKFQHRLEALNIIAGPNDKGKTAAVDAIKLALMGHLPGQPKSNAGIFALSSGAAMMVGVELEDGRKVERAWKQSGKSVKLEEKGVEGLPETPLALMDAAEYFAKSDRGRAEMAFSLLDLSALEETDAYIGAEVLKLALDPDAALALAVQNIIQHRKDATLQQWLDAAIETAAGELGLAKKDVTRFAGTAQGIASLGVSEDVVDPAAIAKRLAQARGELQKLQAEEAACNRSTEEAQKRADAIRGQHRKAEALRVQIGTGTAINASVADLSAALAEAQGTLGALEEKGRAAADAVKAAAEAEQQLEALDESVRNWQAQAESLTALEQKVRTLEEATKSRPDPEPARLAVNEALERRTHLVAERNGLEREITDLERKLRDLETHDQCPTCGTAGKGFKEAVKDLLEPQIAEKRQSMTKLDRDFTAAAEALKKLQGEHNTQSEARAAYDAALEELNGKPAQAQKPRIPGAREKLQEAITAQANLDRAANDRVRLEKAAKVPELQEGAGIEKARRLVETLTAQIGRARAVENLAALGDLEPIPDLEEMGQAAYRLELAIDAKQAEIDAILEDEKKAQSQLADQKRLQQAADERAAAETRVERLGSIHKALLAKREKLVNDALEPLLVTANTFTDGILDTPLEVREGEIGRQVGASWVPVRCFGGTFTAITFAAIQAALGTKAPARIVIVDEMGRMDAINKVRFLENVRKAINAGLLDQFVGIDVHPEQYRELQARTLEIGLNLIEVKG